MKERLSLVQYWGGYPQTANSKWERFFEIVRHCADRGWRTYLVWSRMPDDPNLTRPFREVGCKIILQPRATSLSSYFLGQSGTRRQDYLLYWDCLA